MKIAFSQEFSHTSDTIYISESALFDKLTLGPQQPIEDFHALVSEKGNQLGKPERDIISKFIQGLPVQLAFFVRASRTTSYGDALHSAKIGEAHGYRSVNTLNINAISSMPPSPGTVTSTQPQTRRPTTVCYKCGRYRQYLQSLKLKHL